MCVCVCVRASVFHATNCRATALHKTTTPAAAAAAAVFLRPVTIHHSEVLILRPWGYYWPLTGWEERLQNDLFR